MARPATGSVVEDHRGGETRYGIRFRDQYGKRRYESLGNVTEAAAKEALDRRLAKVKLSIYAPPTSAPIVELPADEPTFHEVASEWVARGERSGVSKRTVEAWKWALTYHLLPFFGSYTPSQITKKMVDRYTAEKVEERARLDAALERWQNADPDQRGRRPDRPLSNRSINRTVGVLAQVLDDAIEDDTIDVSENVARGKRRKLPAGKPHRIWLDYPEIRSLLDVAGTHRPLVATMILTGLRVSELCALRWRAVDTAAGSLRVEDSKTEAGAWRRIDLTPVLLEELKLHRAANPDAGRDAFVFPTLAGTQRDRHNVRSRILLPALDRANRKRAAEGLPPIAHVTNHTLRRTFASVLYDAGASPADVMAQMGHTSAALALEVYAKKMERSSETPKRMDELVDWATTGSRGTNYVEPLPIVTTERDAIPLR